MASQVPLRQEQPDGCLGHPLRVTSQLAGCGFSFGNLVQQVADLTASAPPVVIVDRGVLMMVRQAGLQGGGTRLVDDSDYGRFLSLPASPEFPETGNCPGGQVRGVAGSASVNRDLEANGPGGQERGVPARDDYLSAGLAGRLVAQGVQDLEHLADVVR
jgi:hypothetical protein